MRLPMGSRRVIVRRIWRESSQSISPGSLRSKSCSCDRLSLGMDFDSVFGFALHRQSNEKVLLVCALSSKQKEWFDLECRNVHSEKKYKMLNCNQTKANIPFNAVFPLQCAHLLIQYQQHPEAKSLASNGTPCNAHTKGLLKRAHKMDGTRIALPSYCKYRGFDGGHYS